jgi:hypothetical protein
MSFFHSTSVITSYVALRTRRKPIRSKLSSG